MLQAGDTLSGRPGMVLAAQAEGVVAADIQRVAIDRIVAKGVAVAAHALPRRSPPGPTPSMVRGGAGEILVDEVAGQADSVEDLGAAIGLVGGDAHLGHDLQNALADRLDVVLLHFARA